LHLSIGHRGEPFEIDLQPRELSAGGIGRVETLCDDAPMSSLTAFANSASP
jgi:hypothetical protein